MILTSMEEAKNMSDFNKIAYFEVNLHNYN